jgi:pimeloyl-ACP methyl ester carboxylesterase
VPTLVLSGGDSPAVLRKAGEAVDEALPDSRIVVMTGHGHAAMDTGTDLFTTEVLRFAEGPPRRWCATSSRGHRDGLIHPSA